MKLLYQHVNKKMFTPATLEVRAHKRGAYMAVVSVSVNPFINVGVITQSAIIPTSELTTLIDALTRLRDAQTGG